MSTSRFETSPSSLLPSQPTQPRSCSRLAATRGGIPQSDSSSADSRESQCALLKPAASFSTGMLGCPVGVRGSSTQRGT